MSGSGHDHSGDQTPVEVAGAGLGIDDVVSVTRLDVTVHLTDGAMAEMEASAAIVAEHAAGSEPVYGVSTGFRSLATTPIPADRREQLQLALVRSHSAGMGEPVEREVVRGLMLMRSRSLAMGRSGARPVVAETLLAMLNASVTPVVPEHGSLGASGDLAPLAHCALVAVEEGEADCADGEPASRCRGPEPGRDRAAETDRQGRPRADQRDRRDPRDASDDRGRRSGRPAGRDELSARRIRVIGDPVLRERTREVTGDELRSAPVQELIDEMIGIKRGADGAGIAANQVGETLRIAIAEVDGRNPRYPYKPEIPLTVMVNPEIEPLDDETFINNEGCLSVPDLRGDLPRHVNLRVTYLDREGRAHEEVKRGLTAGTFQHELDHLDGVLFLDRVEDPATLSTRQEFERHGKDAFVARITDLVERVGS